MLFCVAAVFTGSISGLSSCSGDTQGEDVSVFSSEVKEVLVEIDYQIGAEPFTDDVPRFGLLWDLFRANAGALFAGAPRTLLVPTDLSAMQALPAATKHDFSAEDILALAGANRNEASTTSRKCFYVIFLDGTFFDEGKQQPEVIGVSIGSTGVIAVFKPVVSSTSAARFVEQSTLIHEFGHAVGLVNNGVALASPHSDSAHHAHCSNPNCVMYYLNEGGKDLAQFVSRMVKTKDSILFDSACLADTASAAAR
jgi:predicted Zn-dependent protease